MRQLKRKLESRKKSSSGREHKEPYAVIKISDDEVEVLEVSEEDVEIIELSD